MHATKVELWRSREESLEKVVEKEKQLDKVVEERKREQVKLVKVEAEKS